jgi:MFS transporter, AAHS family, 4-hydroxybenzoate transporter
MQSEAWVVPAAHTLERLYLRIAWLCGVVLFLEGYDIAAVGYAIPSLVDAWRVALSGFTQVLTAGNIGLLLGSLGAGLLGDRLGRKRMLLSCVAAFGAFSLLSAVPGSPVQMAGLRFLTGLGLGGGIPLAIALASDFAPSKGQGRLVMLMSVGVPIGFTIGGLLASQLVRVFGWPAIFAVGGMLPLAMMPVLALWLPESTALSAATRRHNPVASLFRDGLAPSTTLLWAMNLINLFNNYFILLWLPAILHGTGVSPPWATSRFVSRLIVAWSKRASRWTKQTGYKAQAPDERPTHALSSSSSNLASFKSNVSKPSVNQPYTGARRS